MTTLETDNFMNPMPFNEVSEFIDFMKELALGRSSRNLDKRYSYRDLGDMDNLNPESVDALNFEYSPNNQDRYDLNQYFAFLELIRFIASLCLENVRFHVEDYSDDNEEVRLYERKVFGYVVSLMIIKDVESKSRRLQISLDSDLLGYDLIIEETGVLTVIRRNNDNFYYDDEISDESEEFGEIETDEDYYEAI